MTNASDEGEIRDDEYGVLPKESGDRQPEILIGNRLLMGVACESHFEMIFRTFKLLDAFTATNSSDRVVLFVLRNYQYTVIRKANSQCRLGYAAFGP